MKHLKNASKNEKYTDQKVPLKIAECKELIDEIFNNSSDLQSQIFTTHKEKAMIVFIDGLANKDLIDRDIIKPIKSSKFDGDLSLTINALYDETDEVSTIIEQLLIGNVGVFYEDSGKAFLVELKGWEKRAVSEPDAEAVVRGPKESFTEDIRTNTSLIRRKIKTPKLVVDSIILGKQTKTLVDLLYIEGIVNQDVLLELKRRLSKIDTAEILETGQIEQFICHNKYSPISGIGMTQKPDSAAQKIINGRIAVVCDGTPHVLIIPELFIDNLHINEDYYTRTLATSFMRIIRTISLILTILLPGIAVAIITFHAEMVPSVFYTSIMTSSQKIPMPIAIEAIVLAGIFELVQIGGARLPNAVGSAITIVGSLVIGEAAVTAGIVSRPMVIVVALTAVAGFLTPNLREFSLVYRFFFLFLGSTMGLIGIGSGLFIMMTQLISTNSFGIPILSSFSKEELKDSIIRFPLQYLKDRPEAIVKENIRKTD